MDHQQITFEFLNRICLLSKGVGVKANLLRKGEAEIFNLLNIFLKCFIIKLLQTKKNKWIKNYTLL